MNWQLPSSALMGTVLAVLAVAMRPGGVDAQGDPESTRLDSLATAAEGGDPEAQYLYGRVHELDTGDLPVDYATAMDWYARAAEQDHVPAVLSLSTMLLGTDPEEAMGLVLRAAELGSAEAQWRAGQVYSGRIYLPSSGLGFDRDSAVSWFTRGADQGHHPSEEALADLFTEADDPENYAESVELYRRAADSGGSAWAVLRMGMIYATGEGVAESDTDAREWFSRLGSEGYDLDPDRFSNEDLEVLGGLQAYYGLDFVGRDGEADAAAAIEAFGFALRAAEQVLFRPFVHPSFDRASRRMLEKLEN